MDKKIQKFWTIEKLEAVEKQAKFIINQYK